MGLWDPQAKILMGPRALGMGLIIDVLTILLMRHFKMRPQDAGS